MQRKFKNVDIFNLLPQCWLQTFLNNVIVEGVVTSNSRSHGFGSVIYHLSFNYLKKKIEMMKKAFVRSTCFSVSNFIIIVCDEYSCFFRILIIFAVICVTLF